MIPLLDALLRDHLIAELAAITGPGQVRFQPPDADFRTFVTNLNDMALNVYLVELRENRELRSNERTRHDGNGAVEHEPAPARVTCHYLITAWSPAQPSPALDPTLDEHALVYEAAAALFRHAPLNPSRSYPPGSLPLAQWPERFRSVDLPTSVLPPEGYAGLREFWSSMGDDARWKPAVHLEVTLPVAMLREMVGPLVTTKIVEYRIDALPETAERWIQIGGHVLDDGAPLPDGSAAPVPGAWVRIETVGGVQLATTRTDERGRFTFARLQPDQYRLRTSAVGLGERTRDVDVPTETGEYDLRFP